MITRHWPESDPLDAALREAILARRNTDGSDGISVVGGWQSKADLLCWPEPEIAVIRQRIAEVTRVLHDVVTAALSVPPPWDLVAEAWAVVHSEGHFHNTHSHPGSAWSGVYYVAVPKGPDVGGTLEFLDPRPGARAVNRSNAWMSIEPRQNHMIAFPSWLLHRVAPVRKPELRVCIAFNVGHPHQGSST
jgi:uncharacterized protein (TIGR02466 family)